MLCSDGVCCPLVFWVLSSLLLAVGAEDNQTSRWETPEGEPETLTPSWATTIDIWNTTDLSVAKGAEIPTQVQKPWIDDEIFPSNETTLIPVWDTSSGTDFPGNESSTTPTASVSPTEGDTTPQVTRDQQTQRSWTPIREATTMEKVSHRSTGTYQPAPNNAERFEYDYYTLRIWGLVVASVLFVVGIAILCLGRVRCPCCPVWSTGRKHGKYNVSSQT